MSLNFIEDALGKEAADLVTKLLIIVAILFATWAVRRFVISWAMPRIAHKLTRRTSTLLDDQLIEVLQPPLRFLVSVVGLRIAIAVLELPDRINTIVDHIMASLVIVALFWAAYRAVDTAVIVLQTVTRRTVGGRAATTLDAKLALAFQQLGKALILVLAITSILQTWGYSVAGLMAGLGLGGLAVALAAQDALANLIGYFVILADEPFVVGEYIVVGDVQGTVERLGFRSTRIRVLDQSLVTVPNKTLVNSNVVNWSRLSKRRLNSILTLPVDSSPRQVLLTVQAIRDMLKAHPLVQPDSVIVQFTDLEEKALKVTIICFMKTPAWADFQAAKQDINLRIMAILRKLGTEEKTQPQLEEVATPAPPALEPANLPVPKPEPRMSTATDSPVPDDAAN